MKETFRFSQPGDPEVLAPLLREADEKEARAAGYASGLHALQAGHRLSKLCLTVEEEDGTPCMMMGVVKTRDPLHGLIWLMGSDFIARKPTIFLRQSKPILELLHRVAPVLGNHVHAENKVHIRWLKWLGFTFLNTTKGASGADFHEFVRVQPCVLQH